MARQSTGRPVGRSKAGQDIYPTQVRKSCLSLKGLRNEEESYQELERLHRLNGHRVLAEKNRRIWNLIEDLLDALIDLQDAEAASHEREVYRHGESAACRLYDNRTDLSVRELREHAASRACTGCGSCATPAEPERVAVTA